MPEGKRSEATIRAEMLVDWMERMVDALMETEFMEPPLGMEEVEPAEYRRRYVAMGPEERLGEVKRMGLGSIMTLFEGVPPNG